MRIGIDISQLAFEDTGFANYLENLLNALLKIDSRNEYVLFFSSLRRNFPRPRQAKRGGQFSIFPSIPSSGPRGNFQSNPNVKIKTFKFPLTLLDLLWNRLHIAPIEWFIGDVDVFITSDWTEPPTRQAKKATILYDLAVYKYPKETDKKIVETQKRKLHWVKKESDLIFCISEATKKDAMEILGIDSEKLSVSHPGI